MIKKLTILFFIFTCIAITKIGNSNNTDFVRQKSIEFYNQTKLNKMIKIIEYESEIQIPIYTNINDVEYMYNTANELNLPVRTIFRLIFKESTFRDTVVSGDGAKGYMQIMPETYKIYSQKLNLDSLNLTYNQKNILIGMSYLNDKYKHWLGKGHSIDYAWKLALASYNAGIFWVILYKGIPPFPTTKKYIDFILKKHRK